MIRDGPDRALFRRFFLFFSFICLMAAQICCLSVAAHSTYTGSGSVRLRFGEEIGWCVARIRNIKLNVITFANLKAINFNFNIVVLLHRCPRRRMSSVFCECLGRHVCVSRWTHIPLADQRGGGVGFAAQNCLQPFFSAQGAQTNCGGRNSPSDRLLMCTWLCEQKK